MADTETSPTERKPRKSVAFSDGTTIVDENGQITTESPSEKATAESHSSLQDTEKDKDVEEVTDMFKDLAKKKKKKSSKPKDTEIEGADGEAPAADGEFDPSKMKKKKKKSKKHTDDFESKLAAMGGEDKDKEEPAEGEAPLEEGDMEKGTGVWAHDCTTPIGYNLLLSRFFSQLHSSHPDLLAGGSRSYKIPPPQCLREGNKKTIFANIPDICRRMKRQDEHVISFLFAELGTSGSTDGSRRLVIKGRFQQKQIEAVLRRYIVEYVQCKTCRSPDTELSKGENRLYFVTCNSCGSRRSVAAVKTGFSAQIGKRRRQQG
ncbi:MAG: hypothetical protein M1834_006453 [Cirrosporium novae-zelandiae]|nr:MAG: hypothetical protein M1834_006453 [Cirrosporium novae-zelandiae]